MNKNIFRAGACITLAALLTAGASAAGNITALRDYLTAAADLAPEQAAASDADGNGILNAVDLTLMKRGLLPAGERQLLWAEEFDGDALNEARWSYETGNWKLDENGNYITNGWGNNEQQYYTDSNTTVRDGILTIAGRKEDISTEQGDYAYTSARICTRNKFSVCGGRIAVRARCDAGRSLWPAIWMLPEDEAYGGWAASGEIDIMEGWGSRPEKICGTIHFGDVWPNNTYLTADYGFPAGSSSAEWHEYAVEWDYGEIRWYVDDILYSTQTDWFSEGHAYPAPFDQNFYIILNLAIGGHFDGVDGIYADPATFAGGEKHFEIDYVRVYAPEKPFTPTPVTSLPLGSYIEGADASVANRDGETVIHIENAGTLEYAVMGLLRGKNVQAGKTFTLSFDAESTLPRTMRVTAEDAAYTRYLDELVTLGTEPVHCSFPVTFPADMKADLKFQLGNIAGAGALGAHTVTLKNITWEEAT